MVLWGKSDASGRPNLLLQHLLDTAAVAELLWDDYLADSVRQPLDTATGGRGRDLFRLLGGWHDLGKATPGFQSKVPALAAAVRAVGLSTQSENKAERWRHELGSARIAREVLADRWPKEHIDWFWPLLAGHHGRVPSVGKLRPSPAWLGGDDRWRAVQRRLAQCVLDELSLEPPVPIARPSRSRQLVLAGHLIMADWIASDEKRFVGVPADQVGIDSARIRAREALSSLGMRRGLIPDLSASPTELARRRFGVEPRPVQLLVAAAAAKGPGLMIVEAPTGEGKTEAALLAVELMSRRTGQDGVFVGLPTQATSDPMYTRVRRWVATFDNPPHVGLLHGKRSVNREWRAAQRRTSFAGVDEYGMSDPYSAGQSHRSPDPEDWFVGTKRGLLQPVAVGTVDQVLQAATRTKHVMLRHAGLASGVVVLDEVHAYDVYMSQFLHEALRWAGAAQVPVILLSATLPPHAREQLVQAYSQGSAQDAAEPSVPPMPGYPAVLSWEPGQQTAQWSSATAYRPSRTVQVSILEEDPQDAAEEIAGLLAARLAAGGTALVVRNTVSRAQQTYRALRDVLGDDVRLLHARLTTGARVDRAEELLRALGPRDAQRPERMVVVATQVAEQSFDIDADLLITDLAPVDLLLQRAGRLHRHDRPAETRPAAVRTPEMIVAGLQWQGAGPPALPGGSMAVYGEHLLLRAAHLVQQADPDGWDLPRQVPTLVEKGYARDDEVPADWRHRLREKRAEEDDRTERREAAARKFLLAGGPRGLHRPTLAGLHDLDTADVDDEAVRAVVRDGEESVEVTLVKRSRTGYATLSGRSLGATGEGVVGDDALLDEVVADSVRLPASPSTRSLNAAARQELTALPGWTGEPFLRNTRALVLDDCGVARLSGWWLRYDEHLGLLHERG